MPGMPSTLSLKTTPYVQRREIDIHELCRMSVTFAWEGNFSLAIRMVRKIFSGKHFQFGDHDKRYLLGIVWWLIRMTVRMHRFRFEQARAENQAFFSQRRSGFSLHNFNDLYDSEIVLLHEELDIVRLENMFNALLRGERPISEHMLVALEKELRYKSAL